MADHVTYEEFVSAEPHLHSGAGQKIKDILQQHACFAKEPSHTMKPSARSVFKRKKFPPRKNDHHRHVQPYSNRKPIVNSAQNQDERAIQCHLNKLSRGNFDSIKRNIRFAVTMQNIDMILEKILQRADQDPTQTEVYVLMIEGLYDSMCPKEKVEAIRYLRADIDGYLGGLRSNVQFPKTDPIKNYEEYCTVTKKKRGLVGRCNTYMSLVNPKCSVKTDIGDYADDIFDAHLAALKHSMSEEIRSHLYDTHTAVETLLECIHVILKSQMTLQQRFRGLLRGQTFLRHPPNSKCKFKIEEILRG